MSNPTGLDTDMNPTGNPNPPPTFQVTSEDFQLLQQLKQAKQEIAEQEAAAKAEAARQEAAAQAAYAEQNKPPTMEMILAQLVALQQRSSNGGSNRIKIAEPDDFSGRPEDARAFLTQCTTYFESISNATDAQKIACALSHMKQGNAWMFAEHVRRIRAGYAQLPQPSEEDFFVGLQTWTTFVTTFKETFHEQDITLKAQEKLQNICQGNRSAEEYVLEFSRYAEEAQLGATTNVLLFKKGLALWLRNLIYALPNLPYDLEGWQHWARKFERQKREQQEFERTIIHTPSSQIRYPIRPTVPSNRPRYPPPPGPPPSQYRANPAPVRPTGPTPRYDAMEVDRMRQQRPLDMANITCYKCKQKGHMAKDCYSKIARIVQYSDGSCDVLEDLCDPVDDESVPAAQEENAAEELPSSHFPKDHE